MYMNAKLLERIILYREHIKPKIDWKGRYSHANDPVNKLLDISYHFLFLKERHLCTEIDFPTEIGFFHKAQSKNAMPFVYDFVEWIRSILIDKTLMLFLRKKKNKLVEVKEKDIKRFLYLVN